MLLLLSGGLFATELELVLQEADPLSTLPMDQLELTLARAAPLQDQASPWQKQQIALLKMRFLAIKGDYAGAMDEFHCLENHQGTTEYRIRANDLAVQITSILGDYVAAFTYLNKAQQLLSWVDSPHQKYSVLANAAVLFAKSGDHDKAMDIARKALHWAEQGGDIRDISTAWNILGDTQLAADDLNGAKNSFLMQLPYAEKAKLALFQGAAMGGLGNVYRKWGQHKEAIKSYQAARLNLQQVDYLEGVADTELGMAESYFALGDMPAAFVLLEPMLPKLEQAKDWEKLVRAYLLFSQIAKYKGDGMLALDWYEQYVAASKQLINQKKAVSLAYQQVKFEATAKQRQISLLEEKTQRMAVEEEAAKQQKIFYLLGISAVLLISLLLGLLLIRALRERRMFRRLSQLDPLTGLHNHIKTYELAQAAFIDCQSTKSPFTVVVADIDYFKQVNDNHGHAAGDEILKKLATHMRRHFTGDSIVGRTGGEEFSFFFPGKTADQVAVLVNGFQQQLSSVTIFSKVITVTLSFGLSMAKSEDNLLGAVVRRADSALYQAKHNGRDQLVHYQESECPIWESLLQVENT